MFNLPPKKRFREKKKLIKFLNYSNTFDQTSIKIEGDRSNSLFIKIFKSFEKSMACESKLNQNIIELDGLSGVKYRYFINNLIENHTRPKYLEIGSWTGSTSCSACYENDLEICCIDNWSEFLDKVKHPKTTFINNINTYLSKKSSFKLIESDFKKVNFSDIGKYNIFFYDGPHHEKDHYDSIIKTQKSLSEKYILIVDDWNWDQVRRGTLNALIELNSKILSKIEIMTTQDNSKPLIQGKYSDWHNGTVILIIEK